MTDNKLFTGHGGRIDVMARAFPHAPEPWLDLSTGINPWPYVVPTLAPEAWTRLPTEEARKVCEGAMANAFGCAPEACRAVGGTEIAIRLLPSILRSRSVAVRSPSYADHRHSWHSAGADVLEIEDPLEVVDDVDTVVLVNPNNPDGHRWSVGEMEEARRRLTRRGGWLIVDEAYADLDPEASMAPAAGRAGLIVLRSFGKFFGLAGVRLGAFLAPPGVLDELGEKVGGWDVSGPALAVGEAAYADKIWQKKTRNRLADASLALQQVLSDAGLQDAGGTELFRYVKTEDAAAVWRGLAENGVAVRRFENCNQALRFGLPPDPQSLSRLAKALAV